MIQSEATFSKEWRHMREAKIFRTWTLSLRITLVFFCATSANA